MPTEKRRQYIRDYYHKKRKGLLEELGGKCSNCESKENLEFDHIDKNTKSYPIGEKILNFSKEKLLEELKKCQLLCKSCHLDKSKRCGDLSKIPWNKGMRSHGAQGYGKGCRCEICKAWKRRSRHPKKIVL